METKALDVKYFTGMDILKEIANIGARDKRRISIVLRTSDFSKSTAVSFDVLVDGVRQGNYGTLAEAVDAFNTAFAG